MPGSWRIRCYENGSVRVWTYRMIARRGTCGANVGRYLLILRIPATSSPYTKNSRHRQTMTGFVRRIRRYENGSVRVWTNQNITHRGTCGAYEGRYMQIPATSSQYTKDSRHRQTMLGHVWRILCYENRSGSVATNQKLWRCGLQRIRLRFLFVGFHYTFSSWLVDID